MASFYMQWHGPNGLKKIANKVRFMSQIFMEDLESYGYVFGTDKNNHFDTVAIDVKASGFTSSDYVQAQFHKYGINVRKVDDRYISVSFDEVTSLYDLDELIEIFCGLKTKKFSKSSGSQYEQYEKRIHKPVPSDIARTSPYMLQKQYKMKFSETNMMRYI